MRKYYYLICILFCLGNGIANAQQYSLLLNFSGVNGNLPFGSLTRFGNKLFGMTNKGGAQAGGNIFSMDTDGTNYKDLWDFHYIVDTNGSFPYASLIVVGNKLYGTTQCGGAPAGGIVFRIDTDGTGFKDLLNFAGASSPQGEYPYGNLTSSGALLYGLTEFGGLNHDGVIFSVDTDGTRYKDLFNFNGVDGLKPLGSLTLIGGKLYGATSAGAANGDGNIFSIDTNGTNYIDMHDFAGVDGSQPTGGLIFSKGMLYGLTTYGGVNNDGNIFRIDTDGTGFKDFFNFNGANGMSPYLSNLILLGSQLFGVTEFGGHFGDGLIFSVDTNGGAYKDRLDFSDLNGDNPNGGLLCSGGQLYGMTAQGGIDDDGIAFRFDTTIINTSSIYNMTASNGDITIYPNPSNGLFKVGIRNYESGSINVEVYNVLGERVYNQSVIPNSQFVIDLSSQADGMYLYRVISNNSLASGQIMNEGKLIIQK